MFFKEINNTPNYEISEGKIEMDDGYVRSFKQLLKSSVNIIKLCMFASGQEYNASFPNMFVILEYMGYCSRSLYNNDVA